MTRRARCLLLLLLPLLHGVRQKMNTRAALRGFVNKILPLIDERYIYINFRCRPYKGLLVFAINIARVPKCNIM